MTNKVWPTGQKIVRYNQKWYNKHFSKISRYDKKMTKKV